MKDIVLIVHDIRSCHNVGSLLRTAEGLGLTQVYFTGYTPYPSEPHDKRLPHIHHKLSRQIHKTALGAEITQPWERHDSLTQLFSELRAQNYIIAGLEQAETAIQLNEYSAPDKIVLLVGREVEGIDSVLLPELDVILEIPMAGKKESFNVVQAAAMALFQFRFH